MVFREFLWFSLLFALASANATQSTAITDTDALSKRFVTFSSDSDLYRLIYEAHQTKIFDDNGVFVETVGLDVAKGIPSLKEFLTANGILMGNSFNYASVKEYLEANIDLRNIFVRASIIDAAVNYNPEAVKDIFTRYNPTTKQLDPKPLTSSTGQSTHTGAVNTVNLTTFKIESVEDIYELILKAYESGLFDRDGNFIEASFESLLREEPNIFKMMKSEQIVNEGYTLDYGAVHRFVQSRKGLLNLLSASGVYIDGTYSAKKVSDVILTYNRDTKQFDITPAIPVTTQTELSDAAKKEVEKRQQEMDDTLAPSTVLANLMRNPKNYIRDALAYGRRNSVFDPEANFDYVNFYTLLAKDTETEKLARQKGIFDEKGNFYEEKFYYYILENPTIHAAALDLGLLTDTGFYSQDSVLAITSYYTSKYELPQQEFKMFDPATVNTVDDVYKVLGRAYKMQIIDEKGDLDFAQLQAVFEQDPVLKENVLNYAIIDGNTIKESNLRQLLTRRPLLRTALVKLGILDFVGRYDAVALQRAVVRAISNPPQEVHHSTTVNTTANITSVESLDKLSNTLSEVVGIGDNKTTDTPKNTVTVQNITESTKASQNDLETKNTGTSDSGSNGGKTALIVVLVVLGVLALIGCIAAIIIYNRKSTRPKKINKDRYHMI